MGAIDPYDKWLYDQVDRYMEEQDMRCCANCTHYFNDVCTKDWNNMDESYYLPDRDDKDPEDSCDDWEYNELYEE